MHSGFRIEMENQSILKHPFYRLWSEGKLTRDALRVYAQQYYHFVNNFPGFLETMLENCSDPVLRGPIMENLTEERKHPALWLAFANSLGLSNEEVAHSEMLPETAESLEAIRSLMRASTNEAAAALWAYETQVPRVAEEKLKGLTQFYGIQTPEALEFFKVHMLVDLEHAKVWESILGDEQGDTATREAMKKSLQAQRKLLDGVLKFSKLDIECKEPITEAA